MTENKRFKLVPMSNRGDIWYGVFDNFENEYVTAWGSIQKVCDKLNELEDENKQLKEKNKKNIQLVFDIIETYSDDCFHHEGGWAVYMLNDLIEDLKNGMELQE